MDYQTDSQYNPENISENPAPSQPQIPIAPPKRKKGRGCLLAVLIAAAVLCCAYSLYRAYVRMNVQIQRTDTGFSITVGEAPPPVLPETAESSMPPAASAQSGKPDAPHSDRTLVLSDSPVSEPTRSSPDGDALSLQEIYEKMIPSVVSIVTNNGSGTGIVMSEDGYLITNYHVIENAYEIAAILNTDETYSATLVGADEPSDLAVLKISPEKLLTPAEFGDSDRLRVGDSVVAIGDPLGTKLRGTMTNGIISAINRDLFVNDREMTLIQTNAALNNGNSGGPLINCYGQVIGINAVKLSASYYSTTIEGLGFAIPISSAKPIIDELLLNGYVSGRPAIGIAGETLPLAVRTYYRLPEGVYVTYVSPDSDACQKGLAAGDIITAANDTPTPDSDSLDAVKNQLKAGDKMKLTVYTQGEYRDITVTLMDAALANRN